MTTIVNFTRKRGDSYPVVVSIVDNAGAALDITGASFKLTVDPAATPTDDTDNHFQSTGSIVGSATAGTVTFPVTAANANLLGVVYYDAEMTDSDSIVSTILEGSITFTQDITKPA